MNYIIPLNINIKKSLQEVRIEENLVLRKYSIRKIRKLWKVDRIHRDKEKKLKVVGITASKKPIIPYEYEYLLYLIGAKYFLELDGLNDKSAVNFSYALQLYKKGKVGYLLALNQKRGPNRYRNINPLCGKPYWITKTDLNSILRLYFLIKESKCKNKKALIEKFATASSVSSQGISGFVELVSIIENILIPDGVQGEISYKLKTRGAVVIPTKHNSKQIWENLTKAYNVRSKWLHQSKNLLEPPLLDFVNDFSRACIIEYLKQPEFFSSDNLNAAVLRKISEK